MIVNERYCVRRPEARTPKSQITALGMSHNVSGARRSMAVGPGMLCVAF